MMPEEDAVTNARIVWYRFDCKSSGNITAMMKPATGSWKPNTDVPCVASLNPVPVIDSKQRQATGGRSGRIQDQFGSVLVQPLVRVQCTTIPVMDSAALSRTTAKGIAHSATMHKQNSSQV